MSLNWVMVYCGLKMVCRNRTLDDRDIDWLNPEMLYRCIDQTIELYFEDE